MSAGGTFMPLYAYTRMGLTTVAEHGLFSTWLKRIDVHNILPEESIAFEGWGASDQPAAAIIASSRFIRLCL